MRSHSEGSEPANAVENGMGTLGPHKGLGLFVVNVDELQDEVRRPAPPEFARTASCQRRGKLAEAELDDAVFRVAATIPLNGAEFDSEAFVTRLSTSTPSAVAGMKWKALDLKPVVRAERPGPRLNGSKVRRLFRILKSIEDQKATSRRRS
jgi:hypothetical protein